MRAPAALLATSLAVALAASAPGSPAAAQESWYAPPVADHHMHLRSADMAVAFLEAQEAVGQRILGPDIGALTAADAIEALDEAGIHTGVVLSTAYLYAMPDVDFEDERARVAAENDWVSRQVSLHPVRLVGFCSANPLSDYALEELRRCAGLPGIAGFKLHLANSNMDYEDPAHVERLREVFRLAEEVGAAIAVHMRVRDPEYGAAHARVFIRELLPLVPSVPVQIAHMAGWGNYDEATDAAMGAFAEAIASGEIARDDLVFDVSGMVPPISRAATAGPEVVARVRDQLDRLAARIREIGTERVVFGSDWEAVPIRGYAANLQFVMPLTADELADVLGNRAAYLR